MGKSTHLVSKFKAEKAKKAAQKAARQAKKKAEQDASKNALIKYGILNFHPGLLPDIRGLDSVLWSIEKNYPIGVTAHLINNKIDAGKLVCQKKLFF